MIVSPVHFREVAAIAETRERAEVTVFLHRYGTNPSCDLLAVRKRAEVLHARRFGVADAHTLPLRRPPPMYSLRVMIDCSGNVCGRRCPCGCRGFTMQQSQFLSEETLIQRAIEILMETLGPVETIRFLSLPRKKRTESVKRHREWQARLEKEQFFTEVFSDQRP
jgi:hypothetical protein